MSVVKLKGAVVAITGGGRGIGLAIAHRLAQEGAKISIGDIDEPLALQATASLPGRRGFGGTLDVRDRASFEQFIKATQAALGPIDVMINNAGIMPMGPFLAEDDAVSDAQIDINLRGVMLGMKLSLPGMLQRGRGHIINVASLAGRFPIPGAAVYCGTKFGVVGMTEAVREEFRDSGVLFTTVLPSRVSTELVAGTATGSGLPTVSPEQVAEAVLSALLEGLIDVTVPRFLAPAPALYGIAPNWLLRRVRKVIRDNRILTNLDRNARVGYEQRIAKLAASQTELQTKPKQK